MPVLESLKCGTIPIIAENSSLPEVGGLAALYAKTGDVNDLADQMAKASDTNQPITEEVIRVQAAKFSWDDFAEDFIQLLEQASTK